MAERRSDVLVRHIDDLRAAMKTVKDAHPFAILAMAVLPEHLHAIWRLSWGDVDYPLRWSLGWVTYPVDWAHSTLHSYIKRGNGSNGLG